MNRNCYCRPNQTHCGLCSICNSPGHVSQHPYGIPYTSCWCDLCYQTIRLANLHIQVPNE